MILQIFGCLYIIQPEGKKNILYMIERFNTTILHHLFDYNITFQNSQHEDSN